MKTPNVENIVVDEVHQRTYVVMARRILTDGEIYSAIRVELLKRGGQYPEKGQRLVITASQNLREIDRLSDLSRRRSWRVIRGSRIALSKLPRVSDVFE